MSIYVEISEGVHGVPCRGCSFVHPGIRTACCMKCHSCLGKPEDYHADVERLTATRWTRLGAFFFHANIPGRVFTLASAQHQQEAIERSGV